MQSLVPFRTIRESKYFKTAKVSALQICPPVSNEVTAGHTNRYRPHQPKHSIQYKRWGYDLYNKRTTQPQQTLFKQQSINNVPYVKSTAIFQAFRKLVRQQEVPQPQQKVARAVAQTMAFKGLDQILSKRNKLQQDFRVLINHPEQPQISNYVKQTADEYMIELTTTLLEVKQDISFQKISNKEIIEYGKNVKQQGGADLIVLGNKQDFVGDIKNCEALSAKILSAQIILICQALNRGQHAIIKMGHNFYQRMNELVYLLTQIFDTVTLFRPFSVAPRSPTKYIICHRFLSENAAPVNQFLLSIREMEAFQQFGVRLVQKKRLFDIYDRISSFNNNYLHGCLLPAWQNRDCAVVGKPVNQEQIYEEHLK